LLPGRRTASNRMPVILKPDVWPVWLTNSRRPCRSSRPCWPR
jgi:hypothetical protein